ncbi:hypothetical protein CPAST_c29070 [Clostridium pasteurianum DSM 525 = ATCC 6013]|uniref:Uncharacterized protein n=1 Tax=Clostridium pasteurianum DSM 525 = ATCC 6013 TaxID=1262449 RepID=A0A0H3J9U1_CLOPA|nr:hypothetical protein [Clostridium pasteurianum]AJA48973.1 hypothetical protein CPAST_c29070 [Clostridium pasteurianum DSM 525 = ATCC 6013]AJA52961.1 hypothetical protein CLPA_c29070 [Clostridium pasteurianum DSM 525 = ATCC 6013]AOZ76180.1 hypothetical protein AQ983_14130 [Clostridium pasteurianum DSM 525 = ATCC 6013]AOZ79976.1 hypothetical protein AQ984_14125 [Clostridium pasteurianum]ELP60269.1 hypothetical protein F502_06517 [Clostridium pasteurianum DSM 525 = ATCC 6013]
MSRHRSHHKRVRSKDSNNNAVNNSNTGSFNFGNIAQLLSNIDINQVSSLLGKMNNTERQTNVVENINTEENYNNDNVTSDESIDEPRKQKSTSREEIIRSINTLVNSDKAELLKVVMEIYGSNKTKTK